MNEPKEKLFWFCTNNSIFARQRRQQRISNEESVGPSPPPMTLEKSVEEATHYMMNGKGGGVLIVPDSLHTEFLKIYAEDLQNGIVHYLIERRTPVFRWLSDLDFIGPRSLTKDEIMSFVKKIQQVIRSFYPNTIGMASENCFFDIVILTTEVGTRSSGEIKTGIHLVMPNLPVTESECLDMRLTIIAELELMGKDMVGWNSWEDIVDECVYKSNGLRMPGSHKIVPCPICERDPVRKKGCPGKCQMKGYLDGKRVYIPEFYLSQNQTLDQDKLKQIRDNPGIMVCYVTIRLTSPIAKPRWILPKHAPSYPHFSNVNLVDENSDTDITVLHDVREANAKVGASGVQSKKRKRNVAGGNSSRFEEDDDSLKTWKNKVVLDNNSDTVRLMQQFLRSSINTVYTQIQIREMFSLPKKPFFIITTKGYGSQNCMNMIGNQKHNNNTIYFLVTARGVSQRCFCKCTGAEKLKFRREGLCKTYKSPNIPLTKELLRKLFPTNLSANPLLTTIEVSRFETNPEGYKGALKRILDEQDEKLFKNLPVPASVVLPLPDGRVEQQLSVELREENST